MSVPILEHFPQRAGKANDMSARASFKLSDSAAIPSVGPLDHAQLAARPETADWRRSAEKEVALLRAHISTSEAAHDQ